MNGTPIKKTAGTSPWVVIALVIAALATFGTHVPWLGALFVIALIVYLATRRSAPSAPAPVSLAGRVEFLERRVAELQEAVDKLRGPAQTRSEERRVGKECR